MRELPGFYFDKEKNRYFRIESGNRRANFVSSSQESSSNSHFQSSAHYDIDSIREIKKKKTEENDRISAQEMRLKAFQLQFNDDLIPENVLRKMSPFSMFLSSRNHRPPNQISSSFTDRFIKPYLPRLLKKSNSFECTNNSLTAIDCKYGILLTGDRQGQIRIYDSSQSSGSTDSSRSYLNGGFFELFSTNLQTEISDASVLSLNSLCLCTRGSAGKPGELIILNSSNFSDTGTIATRKISTTASSLHCIASSDGYIIAGGNKSYWIHPRLSRGNSFRKVGLKSDVLSVTFQFEQSEVFLAGQRNGKIFSGDLRVPQIHLQEFKRKDSLAIYKVLNYGSHYFLSAELDGKIAQWDLRLKSRPVQLYSDFKNSCNTNLGVAIHDVSETLIAAGEDKMLHHWSLKTGHEVSNPVGPFLSPVSHIVPWTQEYISEKFDSRNGELVSIAPRDGYLLTYGKHLDIWDW